MGPEWVRDNVTQSLQFTPANFSARGVARVRQGSGGVGGSGVGAAHEQGALWATQQVDGNGTRDLNHVSCCDAYAAGSLDGREDGLDAGSKGSKAGVSVPKCKLCLNCTVHVPLSHCVSDIFAHCDGAWRNHLMVPLTRQYINQVHRPTHCNDSRALDQPVVLWEDVEIKLL